MAEFVQLSAQSLCYLGDIKGYLPFEKPGDGLLSLDDLLGFIQFNKSQQSQRYLYESLQTSLLADLLNFLSKAKQSSVLAKKKKRLRDYLTFVFLLFAGVLFFGCEGFASVSALFSVFPISGLMIFVISMIFSVISIFIFFGFELSEIAKNLNVSLWRAPYMLPLYVQQVALIKAVRLHLADTLASDEGESREQLLQMQQVVMALDASLDALEGVERYYQRVADKPWLQGWKFVTACVAGFINFGNGYFAGQAFAMAAVALVVGAVAPSFWPVIVLSLMAGFAAMFIYWYVQKTELEKLISRLVGLDSDSIEQLQESTPERRNLMHLERDLAYRLRHLPDFDQPGQGRLRRRHSAFELLSGAGRETSRLKAQGLAESGFPLPISGGCRR